MKVLLLCVFTTSWIITNAARCQTNCGKNRQPKEDKECCPDSIFEKKPPACICQVDNSDIYGRWNSISCVVVPCHQVFSKTNLTLSWCETEIIGHDNCDCTIATKCYPMTCPSTVVPTTTLSTTTIPTTVPSSTEPTTTYVTPNTQPAKLNSSNTPSYDSITPSLIATNSSPVNSTQASLEVKEGLPRGKIALIVIAIVIVLCIIIGCLWWKYRNANSSGYTEGRRTNSDRATENDTTQL